MDKQGKDKTGMPGFARHGGMRAASRPERKDRETQELKPSLCCPATFT